jgi:hypothetical protein
MEIYFEGQLAGVARPVDAITNAQLPPAPRRAAEPAVPTGINYVELLAKPKKEDDDV